MFETKFINPSTLSKPGGYTHIVTIEGQGKLMYLSGQVALDESGNVVGKGDFAAQARQVHKNIIAALKAVGASVNDLIKINTYIVNYKSEYRQQLREIRSEIFNRENPPASTLVGVQALALDDFMIEVEAVAVIR
ncbi:MAG: RidA family protein [Candidatus Binataceae bacterium]